MLRFELGVASFFFRSSLLLMGCNRQPAGQQARLVGV